MDFLDGGICQGRDKYGRTITGMFSLVDERKPRIELQYSSMDLASGTKFVNNSSRGCRFDVTDDWLTLVDSNGESKGFQRIQ